MSNRSGLTIFSVFATKGHPGSKLYTKGPQFSGNRPISSNSCSRPPGRNRRKPSPFKGKSVGRGRATAHDQPCKIARLEARLGLEGGHVGAKVAVMWQ